MVEYRLQGIASVTYEVGKYYDRIFVGKRVHSNMRAVVCATVIYTRALGPFTLDITPTRKGNIANNEPS